METFPIANRRYLFANRRQKISPPNPRGTGYADVGMAYPGVATRKIPLSISATAKLNRRILWGFLNMDGFLRSTIQNNKLNTKEAAAITRNNTTIVVSRLLRGGGFKLAVDEGEEVVLPSMLKSGQPLLNKPRMPKSLEVICKNRQS